MENKGCHNEYKSENSKIVTTPVAVTTAEQKTADIKHALKEFNLGAVTRRRHGLIQRQLCSHHSTSFRRYDLYFRRGSSRRLRKRLFAAAIAFRFDEVKDVSSRQRTGAVDIQGLEKRNGKGVFMINEAEERMKGITEERKRRLGK
jgi:hypothetical protein